MRSWRKFIKLGHLQPDDLLWREGFPNWQPAPCGLRPAGAQAGRPAARSAHASRAGAGAARRRATRRPRAGPEIPGQSEGGAFGQAAEPRRARALRRAGGAGGTRRRAQESLAGRRLPGRAGCGRLVCLSPSRHPPGVGESPAGANNRRRERNDRPQGRGGVFAQGPQRSTGDDRCATASDAVVARRQAGVSGLVRRAAQGGRSAGC